MICAKRFIRALTLLMVVIILASCSRKKKLDMPTNFITPFEKNDNYSASYKEVITFYEQLAPTSPYLTITPFGNTDIGKPLHEIIISKSGETDPVQIRKSGKSILFINNAIHPGEPCGIDASMMLVRDLVSNAKMSKLLDEVVIVMIPVYNIGGALNRSATSRANQDGPEFYGFRGNARNLDLNRDFIKCDSKNARSFNQIYNKWNPDVFVDNHTSNGADYQYVMTLIPTQKDKLSKALSSYLHKNMLPELYDKMKKKKWEMTPYVYARSIPDEGIAEFLDLPRYSSGYAALHNAISFMPETHMLKPYGDRVHSTYAFMLSVLEHISANKSALLKARKKAILENRKATDLDINWTMDRDNVSKIDFKGYEAGYKESKVTGHSRLYYDRSKKFKKEIPFYDSYKSSVNVEVPSSYVIPQAYSEIIERLSWNGVKMEKLQRDTTIKGSYYRIGNFNTSPSAYEGHYLHSDVEVSSFESKRRFYKGDVMVHTDQDERRYIVETLEPQGPDSFFAWNFFDGILMQKEYFSPYVFEELAEEVLLKNKKLNKAFNEKKKMDQAFSEDAMAQLRYIYERSSYFEDTYKLYPVARIF